MKIVILDRDGVINEDSKCYIKSAEEWKPLPGSLEAIARLSQAGYRVIVATNQSGLRRNLLDMETLNEIHEKMHRLTQEAGGYIEAVIFCPDSNDKNPQRKPNPGMYSEISKRLRVNLHGVPAIGDSYRDIKAALAVKAKPILVCTGNGQKTLASISGVEGVAVFKDLATAATHLLSQQSS